MDPEEFCTRIGRNILYLRSYYGMSRKTLAKLIKIPVGRLRRVESGDTFARMYDFHLRRIARVFDITIDALLEENLSQETPHSTLNTPN